EQVRRLKGRLIVNGVTYAPGSFYIPRAPTTLALLERIGQELGTPIAGAERALDSETVGLQPVRVGLWDRYGGSMPSGWTRWLLERFEFPFRVVFPPELDQGALRDKFDVLIFVDGAIPSREGSNAARANRPS